MGRSVDFVKECNAPEEEVRALTARYEQLQGKTIQWLGENPQSIPSRWYALLDEAYAKAARRGCQPTGAADIQLVLDNIPFVYLQPNEDVMRDAFEAYMRAHIPDTLPGNDDDGGVDRIDRADHNVSRVWGPKWTPEQTRFDTFVAIADPQTILEMQQDWKRIADIMGTLRENFNHRFLSLFLVRWVPRDGRGPTRHTLLYLDTHRLVKGLFDPNEMDTTVVEGRTMSRRHMLRYVLEGYRLDDRVDAEDWMRPDVAHDEQAWDAYVCLLTRVIVQRFGCRDVLQTGWVVRRLLRDRYGGLAMRQWVSRIADASDPVALKVALGVDGGRRCPAFRSNGSICDGEPVHPEWSCYCSDHPFMGPPR